MNAERGRRKKLWRNGRTGESRKRGARRAVCTRRPPEEQRRAGDGDRRSTGTVAPADEILESRLCLLSPVALALARSLAHARLVSLAPSSLRACGAFSLSRSLARSLAYPFSTARGSGWFSDGTVARSCATTKTTRSASSCRRRPSAVVLVSVLVAVVVLLLRFLLLLLHHLLLLLLLPFSCPFSTCRSCARCRS